jgi:hypothetical protein
VDTVIRNLAGALALFFRQTRQTFARQSKMATHVPDFPLRCQHCTAAIRLCNIEVTPSPVYVDAAGHLLCDHEGRILHRPMPSILG